MTITARRASDSRAPGPGLRAGFPTLSLRSSDQPSVQGSGGEAPAAELSPDSQVFLSKLEARLCGGGEGTRVSDCQTHSPRD